MATKISCELPVANRKNDFTEYTKNGGENFFNFDPELVKLVENGFNVVSPAPDARKEEPCNS